MELINPFAVPLLCAQLDLDVVAIEKVCQEYRATDKGRLLSNIGGYQSNDFPRDNKYTKPLIDNIIEYSNIFSQSYGLNIKSVVDSIWFNINGYKDYNQPHVHPLSIFSGVYYVKTPKNCGNIVFENPASDVMGYAHCAMIFKESNKYNSSHWMGATKENLLFIFPSWLKHEVKPNMSNDERISISFNTISA